MTLPSDHPSWEPSPRLDELPGAELGSSPTFWAFPPDIASRLDSRLRLSALRSTCPLHRDRNAFSQTRINPHSSQLKTLQFLMRALRMKF